MENIVNEIFGGNFGLDKEALKGQAIQSYIDGKITKKQLDEKMEQLKRG